MGAMILAETFKQKTKRTTHILLGWRPFRTGVNGLLGFENTSHLTNMLR